MIPRAFHGLALFGALLLGGCEEQKPAAVDPTPPQGTPAEAPAVPRGTGFDFYVLALSWSPSYCEAEGAEANRQQCGSGRGLGFVVHGLWPQFERGYPEFCASREPDRVPDPLVRRYIDLIPSAGLIGHQWRKHGSCSGLSQADYLAATRLASRRVAIPAAYADGKGPGRVDPDRVEAAFLSANPGLQSEGVAVTCTQGLVREVRICMTSDLSFRGCPEIDRGGCRADTARMPAP